MAATGTTYGLASRVNLASALPTFRIKMVLVEQYWEGAEEGNHSTPNKPSLLSYLDWCCTEANLIGVVEQGSHSDCFHRHNKLLPLSDAHQLVLVILQ